MPLHTAFAKSCNNHDGRLAVNLPPDGLTKAAAQLGLGLDFTAPGMTTVTGSVPVADTSALRVEEGIGRARSPRRRSGWRWSLRRWPTVRYPCRRSSLAAGHRGPHPGNPLPAGVDGQIKAMMAETVSGGTATQLQDIAGMLGKTGTAEYVDPTGCSVRTAGSSASTTTWRWRCSSVTPTVPRRRWMPPAGFLRS